MKKFLVSCMILICFAVLAGCTEDKKDTTAPVFENVVENKLPAKQIALKEAVDFLVDVKANDDVDGNNVQITVDTTSLDIENIGTYEITYTAVDKAGNIATIKRNITVVDTIAPLFNSAQNGVLPAQEHLQYAEYNVSTFEYLSVRDNYDKELTVTIKDLGGYNKDVAGVYTITYSCKDVSGNEAIATSTLTVKEAIKYTVDVLKLNDTTKYPVQYNNETALTDEGSGLLLRFREELQLMTKDFYSQQVEQNRSQYATNGGVPFLPYGVAVILDSEMKPVVVRNAAYAIEAVLVDGEWQLLKNGVVTIDGVDVTIKTNFIDSSAPTQEGAGILGGNFESYIPEGGYVVLAGSPYGGNKDLGKIFLLSNLLDPNFTGGALAWNGVEVFAVELLEKADFDYVQNETTLYPKPTDIATPEIEINNHVLSWKQVEFAKNYQVYIDGELVLTTTSLSVKLSELGLEPNVDGEHYNISVKAMSNDIRYHGDSQMSNVLAYVMPNATTLEAPVISLDNTTIIWEAVSGATSYVVYATQVGDPIVIATTTECGLDLSINNELAKLIANAMITVKAVGDGVEYLDSNVSNSVVYYCGSEKVISFDGVNKLPVIETTAADYFARRNDATEVGYANKQYIYLIKDAHNIASGSVEAFSYLVLTDKDGNVKAMINIVNTTQQYYNGEWVAAATINYTGNSQQITPILPLIAEGDQLLIGRTGGNFTIGELSGLQGRDVLAHYFHGAYTVDTITANQPWRKEHTVTEFPKGVVSPANAAKLNAVELMVNGTIVSWEAVDGATGYELYINGELKETLTTTSFDLLTYVKEIGRSGTDATANNYKDVDVKVVAIAEGKESSDPTIQTYTVSATLTDGTTTMDINYNLSNTLWNGGSGANMRLNDKVGVVFDGASYKAAAEAYKSGHANNGGVPYSPNSLVVVLDKNMNVKVVRFGYVTLLEIQADGTYKTTELTWNNTVDATNGGGQLKGINDILADDDYIVIMSNAGSKNVLTKGFNLFVDSRGAEITAKTFTPSETSETKVDYATTKYEIKFTVVAK